MHIYCYLMLSIALISSLFSELIYWRPAWGKNFGDELSPLLVERILGRRITRNEPRLLAIGSIIHFSGKNDHIWGSGVNGKVLGRNQYIKKRPHVHAVRGPLTRQFLSKFGIVAPPIYGDPALLIPDYFPELTPTPSKEYVIVPHYSEVSRFEGVANVIDPRSAPLPVIRKILNARFVISSSLHGLIIAEAFGIPARHLRVSKTEPDFKYIDYYLGTGRGGFTSAHSVTEALEMGGEPAPVVDKQALIDAFPFAVFKR